MPKKSGVPVVGAPNKRGAVGTRRTPRAAPSTGPPVRVTVAIPARTIEQEERRLARWERRRRLLFWLVGLALTSALLLYWVL